ncbi:Exopolyphosphatase [Linnemannia zychae]|nr:Exopolyphosphatase [Linnemannia zychae]
MNTFLTNIRPRLASENYTQVIVVTGNESADLDSIVSALSTAFFLSHSNDLSRDHATLVLPYINIPKIDLALRSDVEYVLETNNINRNLIFFRDDLPLLERIAAKGLLSLFLVDHNEIMGTMSSLSGVKVVGVIDHHDDEGLYKDTANPRRIEVVGSCSSLVADHFLKTQMDTEMAQNGGKEPTWVKQLSQLLLGPILIDTQNLNPDRHKVRPLDVAMTNLIFPYTGWASLDDLYQKIEEARKDTSRLSFYDLLRKDYKEWTVQQYETMQDVKIGLSSVIGLMAKYKERDTKEVMQKSMDLWAHDRDLDILMVLLSDDLGQNHGGYQRQLIVNPLSDKVPDITSKMEEVAELQLERTAPIDTKEFVERGGRAYLQHNSTCSRKQVWPIVEKVVTQLPQNSNL